MNTGEECTPLYRDRCPRTDCAPVALGRGMPPRPLPRHLPRLVALTALLLAAAAAPARSDSGSEAAYGRAEPVTLAQGEEIKVYFRNNKGWFKPITLIYYVPGDERGQIESRLLLPWQRFSMELPTGTRVYIATAEQVERWRAGESLRHLPAAMTIRDSDAGELYNLFR